MSLLIGYTNVVIFRVHLFKYVQLFITFLLYCRNVKQCKISNYHYILHNSIKCIFSLLYILSIFRCAGIYWNFQHPIGSLIFDIDLPIVGQQKSEELISVYG